MRNTLTSCVACKVIRTEAINVISSGDLARNIIVSGSAVIKIANRKTSHGKAFSFFVNMYTLYDQTIQEMRNLNLNFQKFSGST